MIYKHWRMNLVVNICWLSRIKNLFILATVKTLIIAAVCWTKWLECSSPSQEVCFFPVTSCNMWLIFILLQWLLTFVESAKFLKVWQKISSYFIVFFSRCWFNSQVFAVFLDPSGHSSVPQTPNLPPTPEAFKNFLEQFLNVSEMTCGKTLQKFNVSSWLYYRNSENLALVC